MDASRLDPHRRRLLRIYLNDHLTGAVAASELARRALASNRGTALGAFLQQLLDDILDDRRALEDLMRRMRFPVDCRKVTAAAVAEKVGRLKLNGRLLGYSDLSRVVELEGLTAGVALKLRLWHGLAALRDLDPELAATDVERLADRAAGQLAALDRHRLEAVRQAIAGERRQPVA
jgi:hypothetical protein